MLLIQLTVISVVAQVMTFEIMIGDADVPLGVAGAWYVATTVTVASLTVRLLRLAVWLNMTKRRPKLLARFRHWGMGREVVDRPDISLTVIWIAWCGASVYLAVSVVVPVIHDTTMITGYLRPVVIWVCAMVFPASRMADDYRDHDMKRRELDSLRPVFHNRFPVSEILSMYECINAAPRIFWEEYTNLPDVQVNEATNRKFRERVASYAVRENTITQRTMLLVAVVTIIVAVLISLPTLSDAVTDGSSLVEWFRRMFDMNANMP